MFACDVQDTQTTVYVKNLHPNVTNEILRELFSQVGPVLYVVMPKIDAPTTTSRLHALLTSEATTPPTTDIDMQSLRGLFEPFGTIMSYNCTSNTEAFVVFDSSTSCKTAATNLNGMKLGSIQLTASPRPVVDHRYAFIVFDGEESVLYAMRVLTGTELFGKQIVVQRRQPPRRRDEDVEQDEQEEERNVDISKCIITGLPQSLMHVDIRDMAEWAARSPVVDMQLVRESNQFRQCTITFGSRDGSKTCVENWPPCTGVCRELEKVCSNAWCE